MDKQQHLEILMLLSALESWSFSVTGSRLPDYLYERIANAVEALSKEVLK